jgi:hypothetical protein
MSKGYPSSTSTQSVGKALMENGSMSTKNAEDELEEAA